MIRSYDPYFRDRWQDKVNPEQSSVYYQTLANTTTTTGLGTWYLHAAAIKGQRYGDIDDSDKETRSDQDRLELLVLSRGQI